MKKLLGPVARGRMVTLTVLILMILSQSGCKKSEAQPELSESRALLYLASGDGAPVDEVVIDGTHETLVPINKKEGWPRTQAGATPVGVRFIDAGKTLTVIIDGQPWHYREVYIISFRLL